MGIRAAARSRNEIEACLREQSGQALILALGGALALLAGALVLVAIAGAVTGKGRVQRAADLAAISAARSMRDDLPRLLSPPALPNGLPNPAHIDKPTYLAQARVAALEAGRANGIDPRRLRLTFPDLASFAPLRARAVVVAGLDLEGGQLQVEASAVAEAAAPATASGGMPATASGGGYSGPLVYRNGEGMRPDVAAAFDRMAAAARSAGISLLVVSGFRSDAEQAALFAAHPDPQWVAPPGHSLHRCATELDLGPSSAYSWLAADASRFGFVQRYSWEAWHYGFDRPPAPCSEAGNSVAAAGGEGAAPGGTTLPTFVPSRFRDPLLDAAAHWSVSAALLAAQLMAESNFNPFAVSPAGAQGIAQFIPGTAASYGLDDPFDPVAAIDAQAHLMSDLIRRLGSPELALAAYNAGPASVEACHCIPAIPETQAYVTRILALLGGAGALVVPSFEVRLVA
jgi:Transglycosylase SLT domain/D-alanyl-D-alanine carboxypeptidase